MAGIAVLIGMAGGPAAGAEPEPGIDFHTVFEERCLSCHGHAGPFVRERLTLEDGTLYRSNGQPLAPFLEHHAGGLSAKELRLFLDVFAAQIESGGLYKDRCEICHDRARELARLELVLRDGRLVGRYTGRDIGEFLTWHGRLTEEEADRMTKALKRILQGAR